MKTRFTLFSDKSRKNEPPVSVLGSVNSGDLSMLSSPKKKILSTLVAGTAVTGLLMASFTAA
ncbi:TPA: hypothetical protein ACS28X_005604, partial [Klebsiella pneumoniae]